MALKACPCNNRLRTSSGIWGQFSSFRCVSCSGFHLAVSKPGIPICTFKHLVSICHFTVAHLCTGIQRGSINQIDLFYQHHLLLLSFLLHCQTVLCSCRRLFINKVHEATLSSSSRSPSHQHGWSKMTDNSCNIMEFTSKAVIYCLFVCLCLFFLAQKYFGFLFPKAKKRVETRGWIRNPNHTEIQLDGNANWSGTQSEQI